MRLSVQPQHSRPCVATRLPWQGVTWSANAHGFENSKGWKLARKNIRFNLFIAISQIFQSNLHPFTLTVYAHMSLTFKICQTVVSTSIISQFHDFFFKSNFWRDFAIWPNCNAGHIDPRRFCRHHEDNLLLTGVAFLNTCLPNRSGRLRLKSARQGKYISKYKRARYEKRWVCSHLSCFDTMPHAT